MNAKKVILTTSGVVGCVGGYEMLKTYATNKVGEWKHNLRKAKKRYEYCLVNGAPKEITEKFQKEAEQLEEQINNFWGKKLLK